MKSMRGLLRTICLLLVVVLPEAANPQQGTISGEDVVEAKHTVLGLYLDAREAYKRWSAEPGKVRILDVRTPEEFIFVGHAEMAVNIPLAFQSYRWSAKEQAFEFRYSREFLDEVRAWASPDDILLVMCRSGGRSAKAVNLLAKGGVYPGVQYCRRHGGRHRE